MRMPVSSLCWCGAAATRSAMCATVGASVVTACAPQAATVPSLTGQPNSSASASWVRSSGTSWYACRYTASAQPGPVLGRRAHRPREGPPRDCLTRGTAHRQGLMLRHRQARRRQVPHLPALDHHPRHARE